MQSKHQFLIDKRKSTALKHFNDPKAFNEYWNDMDGNYKNIEEQHPNRPRKNFPFWFFDDMITVTFSNKKKLNPVVAELFIGSGKWNTSLVFIAKCYLAVPKKILY